MRLTKGKKRSADRVEKKSSAGKVKGPVPTAASLGYPGRAILSSSNKMKLYIIGVIQGYLCTYLNVNVRKGILI